MNSRFWIFQRRDSACKDEIFCPGYCIIEENFYPDIASTDGILWLDIAYTDEIEVLSQILYTRMEFCIPV